jgi:hypothetical protein
MMAFTWLLRSKSALNSGRRTKGFARMPISLVWLGCTGPAKLHWDDGQKDPVTGLLERIERISNSANRTLEPITHLELLLIYLRFRNGSLNWIEMISIRVQRIPEPIGYKQPLSIGLVVCDVLGRKNPFILQASGTEIYKQPHLQTADCQIADNLRQVTVIQPA